MPDSPFNPVVLAPTFNNVRTLAGVLARVDALGMAVIVVDDGSGDGTAEVLRRWEKGGAQRWVVTHSENRGKAAALATGFGRARELGFSHAVTIDTDGQLRPEEIPSLVEAARKSPRALVVGCRDETAADYAEKSRLGR